MNVQVQTKPSIKLEIRGPRVNFALELMRDPTPTDPKPWKLVLWNGWNQGAPLGELWQDAEALAAQASRFDLDETREMKAYAYDLAHEDQPDPEAVWHGPDQRELTAWEYVDFYLSFTRIGAFVSMAVCHVTAEPDLYDLRPF